MAKIKCEYEELYDNDFAKWKRNLIDFVVERLNTGSRVEYVLSDERMDIAKDEKIIYEGFKSNWVSQKTQLGM